jgi:hypothetical protein
LETEEIQALFEAGVLSLLAMKRSISSLMIRQSGVPELAERATLKARISPVLIHHRICLAETPRAEPASCSE